MKMRACNLVTNLAGLLKLAGHLENKIPLNLNVPLNLNAPLIWYWVPGIIIITACKYKVSYVCKRGIITINVPLFKKLRDIIFFWGENHFMSHFEGHFEGAKTFLTP